MAVLTLHHWSDLARGLAELRRVASNRAVVLSIAPDSVRSFRLTARYFPAIRAWDDALFLPRPERQCAGRPATRRPTVSGPEGSPAPMQQ
jgi:hypothetical protein